MAPWLPDAFGPDGIRVTFCVTTTFSRYLQPWQGTGLGPLLTNRSEIRFNPGVGRYLGVSALNLVQRLFKTRYTVTVEADGERPFRLTAENLKAAEALAASVAADVREHGLPALATWRNITNRR